MEPLVASTLPAVLRPTAAALQSDLAAVLRDGRLLAGEVLLGASDGNVLLALGRHRVPAQTDVRLDPGQTLLFRVEETESGVVLRVLDGAEAEEPALLRALRAVVAHERPVGEILNELAAKLRARNEAPADPAAGTRGKASAEAPATARGAPTDAATTGRGAPAEAAATTRGAAPTDPLAAGRAAPSDANAAGRGAAPADAPGAGRAHAPLEGAPTGRTAAQAGAAESTRAQTLPTRSAAETAAVRTLLTALAAHGLRLGANGAALRELFLRSGLRYESQLLEAGRGRFEGELAGRLRGDLKGELLRAFSRLETPALRETVARSLAGLEAEQLLNVARERAGEPQVWSLPLQDGGEWTTLRLLVQRRDEGQDEGKKGQQSRRLRLVLGLTLTNTGPIRIDVLSDDAALSVRLLVVREDVEERLREQAEEIAQLLAAEGRTVHVATRRGTPAEVAVGERPLDTRFLQRHHLMDVSG